tara:strand:+ start:80 stop:331 length:252 start_codon:yes stop_codon:yes gene_type:complete
MKLGYDMVGYQNTKDPLRMNCTKKRLLWIGLTCCGVLVAIGCLIGCGTARGIISGVESTGSGIIQDFRGAVDGIDKADESGGE